MENRLVKDTKADRVFMIFTYIFVFLSVAIVLYPLIYIVSASFSDPLTVNSGSMWLYPKGFTLEGYKTILENNSIWRGYLNTIYYTALGTFINLLCTLPAAYALSRPDFYGHKTFTTFLLITMFVSGGLIPSYLLVKNLNMLNTVWALVLPVTRTFFQTTIPREMEEAAIIDGCNDFKLFTRIILPLSTPIIAVMALFYGVGHWNSFFSALIYLSDKTMYPLQMVLREILVLQDMSSNSIGSNMTSDMAELMFSKQQLAAVIKYGVMIVSTLPIIVAYPFLQKYFVKGMMVGSVKG
jgi:putative aldouronate transport system permease protein